MWNASFKDSCFEAETLEELSNQIAEFYAQDNMWLPAADSIENGNQSLSESGLQKFNEACEYNYQAEIEDNKAELAYQQQVKSEYYSNIL